MSNTAGIVKLPAEDHTEAMRMIRKYAAKMEAWSLREKDKKNTETIVMAEPLEKEREGIPERPLEGWIRLKQGTILEEDDQVYSFSEKEFWDIEKYSIFEPGETKVDNVYATRKIVQEKKSEKPEQKTLTSGEFLDKMNSMV